MLLTKNGEVIGPPRETLFELERRFGLLSDACIYDYLEWKRKQANGVRNVQLPLGR